MSRKIITQVLEEHFSKKDAKKFEQSIFDMCKKIAKRDNLDFKTIYQEQAYEKIGELINGDPSKICLDIDAGKTGWSSSLYKPIRDKKDLENARIIEPPDVKEGVDKCKKCGSKKTWSYQLQTRSADEPMTTFVTCANPTCKYKWRY